MFKLRPVERDVDLCEMQARQMVIAHEASHTLLRANIPCTGLPQGDTFSAEEFLSHIRSLAPKSPTLSALLLNSSPPLQSQYAVPEEHSPTELSVAAAAKSGLNFTMNAHIKTEPLGAPGIRLQPGAVDLSGVVQRAYAGTQDESFEAGTGSKVEHAVDMSSSLIRRLRNVARRRKLEGYHGTEQMRCRGYLTSVLSEMAKQLPPMAQTCMARKIHEYLERPMAPETFVAEIQDIVDQYGVCVPLSRRTAPGQPAGRAPPPTKPSGKRGAAGGVDSCKNKRQARAPSESSSFNSNPSPRSVPERDVEHTPRLGGRGYARGGAGADNSDLLSELSSRAIPDTPLSKFLTARARAHISAREGVTVKVLSHTLGETGSGANKFRYHKKAVFAFWHDDNDSLSDMMLLGMYVHEFDANCSAAAQRPPRGVPPGAGRMAGRVLLECVDSIPLMGGESAETRQKVLTAVILGYIDFVRQAGYRTLHLRVPPADEEATHIFNARSSSVRAEATYRMSNWFKRLLDACKTRGMLSHYESSGHMLALEDFPKDVLPAPLGARESKASAITTVHPRFFVAALCTPPGKPLPVDTTPLAPSGVLGNREDLVSVCAKESLAFSSVSCAKFSTMYLLSRVIRQHVAAAGAPPLPPAGAGGNAYGGGAYYGAMYSHQDGSAGGRASGGGSGHGGQGARGMMRPSHSPETSVEPLWTPPPHQTGHPMRGDSAQTVPGAPGSDGEHAELGMAADFSFVVADSELGGAGLEHDLCEMGIPRGGEEADLFADSFFT